MKTCESFFWSHRVTRFVPAFLFALPVASFGANDSKPVTFNHDIAPIIYHNCTSCHRPGEAAPFDLLSYQDVVKKAKTIGKVTKSRAMPPWKAESASYAYRDERRLSEN